MRVLILFLNKEENKKEISIMKKLAKMPITEIQEE